MGYPYSISMRPFGEYPKSKTVRALPKADNIILMWSLVERTFVLLTYSYRHNFGKPATAGQVVSLGSLSRLAKL